MSRKIVIALFLGAMMISLQGSEVSEKKIRTITQIVRWEFNKVISPARKTKRQKYANVRDPKIKTALYAIVQKRVRPFETKAKQVGISAKDRSAVYKSVAKRFPYKTPGEIAQGAIAEAEREYPLVKTGDDVTIRYYRNGIFSKLSGKVQSIRDDGQAYEIGNQLVKLSEIQKADLVYFDPSLNENKRKEFIAYYQKNFAKIKRDYTNYLLAEALEKVIINEKNGYIFFKNRWVTAKYVTDQLYVYYQKVTAKRIKVETEQFAKPKTGGGKKK